MQLSKIDFLMRPFVLAVSMLLAISVVAQTERSIAGVSTKLEPPKVGLRVTEVVPGSVAEEAGLQTMDVLSQYGSHEIVDAASYFRAREAYQEFSESKVAMVYWRGRERIATWVKPGRLGIEFNEYGAVAYDLDSLMQKLNALIALPEYFVAGEIAKGAMQPRDVVVTKISGAIDQAESDGSLTPAQILVARINAIPDDASQAEVDKQSGLINELIAQQPRGFTDYLGYKIFFRQKRFRPAVACFKRTLELQPSDVSTRLNLGTAYFMLRMFAEADAAVDHVLKDGKNLNDYGRGVAFQVKANAALGRRDFASALNFAEIAFRANPRSDYLMSLWQFAAAQTGDLERFYQVIKATEEALPSDYARLRGRTDAIEAYILFKNNQPDKARAIVQAWQVIDNLRSHAKYWRQYPSGEDVVKVWEQLSQSD
jgi:tetratricopeptide (TPR) repeat protein